MDKKKPEQACDFMAVGAHPDDIELMAGGTVAKLTRAGRAGVLVDLTAGEMGTRGTPAQRNKESHKAAKVLGVDKRLCLELPDGALGLRGNTEESLESMVACIRQFRPKVLMTHFDEDEHPDHTAAHELVKRAWYLAGLSKFKAPGKPFRPERIFYFLGNTGKPPSFCVDVSDVWKIKRQAIACYSSQFKVPGSEAFRGKTDIASPDFLEYIETRNRYWGTRIKRKYAEPFICDEVPEVADLTQLGGKRF